MKRRRWPIVLLIVVLLVAVFAGLFAPDRFQEGQYAVTVSRATTRVTIPIGPDGSVNFAVTLNDYLSEGVTAETNATPLLVEVIGLYGPSADEFEESLFTDWNSFCFDEDAEGRLDYACRAPWTDEECPLAARWLAGNEEALAKVVLASRRSRLYLPVFSGREPIVASGAAADFLLRLESVFPALVARAMRSAGRGEFDAAREDLLAGYRLAVLMGRRPPGVLPLAVAMVCDRHAGRATRTLAGAGLLTAEQARTLAADLRSLPPFQDLGTHLDRVERLVVLDYLGHLARVGLRALFAYSRVSEEFLAKPSPYVDWDEVHEEFNVWFDRMSAGASLVSRVARADALSDVASEFGPRGWLATAAPGRVRGAETLMGVVDLSGALIAPAREFEAKLGRIASRPAAALAGYLMPSPSFLLDHQDRFAANRGLTLTALAVAAFRAEEGRLPGSLEELTDAHPDPLPLDPFTIEPFLWLEVEGGRILRFTGDNGTDDGGAATGADDTEEEVFFAE